MMTVLRLSSRRRLGLSFVFSGGCSFFGILFGRRGTGAPSPAHEPHPDTAASSSSKRFGSSFCRIDSYNKNCKK